MRKIVLVVALVSGSAAFAQSDHYVRGYTRSDGTYVAPHMQTNPNTTLMDNYSTRGNVNPYTGQPGTVDPYGNRGAGVIQPTPPRRFGGNPF